MWREVYRHSMKANGGLIVNIIADMWRNGMGYSGGACRHDELLTETAAVEWGPDGVRVNAVAPGWIMSSGFDTYDDPETANLSRNAGLRTLETHRPEAELSAAVVPLSPAAGFITGTRIRVDGGVPNASTSRYRRARARCLPMRASTSRYAPTFWTRGDPQDGDKLS